jgi:hypothetical protein
MWRRERPREKWLGKWVTGADGLSTWESGDEGWESLSRLIAQCLRRVPESWILHHARGSIAPNVRNPVDVLAWRLRTKVLPLNAYGRKRDFSKPARYVLEEEVLSPAEQKARQHARHTAEWNGVRPADSSAAEELHAAREKAKVDGAARRTDSDTAEQERQAEAQARRERREARDAALRKDELWRQRKAEAAAEAAAAEDERWDRILAKAGIRTSARATPAPQPDRPAGPPVVAAPRPTGEQSHAAAKAQKKAEQQAAAQRARSSAAQAAIDQIRRLNDHRA